jgi:hypothetical protein
MTISGILLSLEYDSVLRLTKSIQKPPSCIVAVSKCFDFSGFFDTTPTACDFRPFLSKYLYDYTAHRIVLRRNA